MINLSNTKTLLLVMLNGGAFVEGITFMREYLPSLYETLGDNLHVGIGEMRLNGILPAKDMLSYLGTEGDNFDGIYQLAKDRSWRLAGGTDEDAVMRALEAQGDTFGNIIYVANFFRFEPNKEWMKSVNFIGVSHATLVDSARTGSQPYTDCLYKHHVLSPDEFRFWDKIVQVTYPEMP